jgi:hypothetical protein
MNIVLNRLDHHTPGGRCPLSEATETGQAWARQPSCALSLVPAQVRWPQFQLVVKSIVFLSFALRLERPGVLQ